MSRKLLAAATTVAVLGLPTAAVADFQNMVGGLYSQYDNDADASLNTIGVLGSHFLSTVDTSGLALEAPFMQRIGYVTAALSKVDGEFDPTTDVDGHSLYLDAMIPVHPAGLFLGVELGQTDFTIDFGTDVDVSQRLTGLSVGYYIQKYTTVTVGYARADTSYNPENPPFVVDFTQDTISLAAETLLYNEAGNSLKFGAEVAKTSDSENEDFDSFGVSARFFPTGKLGFELGLEQVRYDVDTASDEQTISLGVEAFLDPGVFLSATYESESQSGANGVDGEYFMLMGAWTF